MVLLYLSIFIFKENDNETFAINFRFGFKNMNGILGSLEILKYNYFHYVSPIGFGNQEANVFL